MVTLEREPRGTGVRRATRLLTFVIVIAGLSMAFACFPVNDWLKAFIDWTASIGIWGPVVMAAAYIPATVLMIPGSIPTLGAGFAFGVAWGTVAVSVGSVLGSSLAFIIGRTVARDWVRARMQGSPKLQAIDRAVGENGFKIALLIRLSPAFPYNLMGYVFGITNIRFRDHFFASWIGMFPGTIMYVYIGATARNLSEVAAGGMAQRSDLQYLLFGVGLLATIVVTVLVTRIARRAIREYIPEAEEGDSQPEAASAS